MTLKTTCVAALEEIHGIDVPSSFIGNVNETAVRALRAIQNEGNFLEITYSWVELLAEHTFTTVADQSVYTKGDLATSGIPSNFRKFANESEWDRTNYRSMVGSMSSQEWQFLNSSVAGDSGTITRFFRQRGTSLEVYPTPSATGDTLAYDYYSKNWITLQSDSSAARVFASDNDTFVLDEDLVRLGISWRFKKSSGFPFEAEYKEWDATHKILQAQNGGRPTLNMHRSLLRRRFDIVPDQGYGLS